MKPEKIKVRTMRDSLARLAFEYERHGDPRPYRDMGEAWAAPASGLHVEEAYRMADAIIETLQLWGDRTTDGKVATAIALKMPAQTDSQNAAVSR